MLTSESQCALALALHFRLEGSGERASQRRSGWRARLDKRIRSQGFKISTGFAGTPIMLDCLADAGMIHLAYRMLQEKQCPSWLYPISMGATTCWERWDSMLPDGTINPGEMTSFNHFALGSVAHFFCTHKWADSSLESRDGRCFEFGPVREAPSPTARSHIGRLMVEPLARGKFAKVDLLSMLKSLPIPELLSIFRIARRWRSVAARENLTSLTRRTLDGHPRFINSTIPHSCWTSLSISSRW